MRTLIRTLSVFILLVLFSSLGVLSAFEGLYPRPLGPQFDIRIAQNYRNQIESQRTGVVLLGDSMLGKGVDAQKLEKLLGRSVQDRYPRRLFRHVVPDHEDQHLPG